MPPRATTPQRSEKAQPAPKKPAARRAGFFSRFGLGHERDAFVENLATLAGSGMAMLSALEAMEEEARTPRMKAVIAAMRDEVDGGAPLSKAMAASGLFSEQTLSLIRVGEESGKLTQNLHVVAVEQAKSRQFRSKVNSALMYPAFVLGLAAFIGLGIAWFILPKLADVFSQLKVNLPLLTRLLIQLGEFLGKYGDIAIPLALALVVLIGWLLFGYRRTRFVGQAILLHLPGAGRLVRESELSRFAYLAGVLLEAGVPIDRALRSVAAATSYRPYARFYTYLAERIEEGSTFKQSFAGYPGARRLLPVSVQQLIISGEQASGLPAAFARVAETYDDKLEISTKNLTVILEPLLLVFVWLGVVGVALAVVMPIYTLVGQFNY